MPKHTPGPWKVAHSGYANTPFVVYAGERAPEFESAYPLTHCEWIAEVKHDESEMHDVQQADARLITAAPDLLDALKQAHRYLFTDAGPDAVDRGELATQIETAMTKAEAR